jgi:hypothetical protein
VGVRGEKKPQGKGWENFDGKEEANYEVEWKMGGNIFFLIIY